MLGVRPAFRGVPPKAGPPTLRAAPLRPSLVPSPTPLAEGGTAVLACPPRARSRGIGFSLCAGRLQPAAHSATARKPEAYPTPQQPHVLVAARRREESGMGALACPPLAGPVEQALACVPAGFSRPRQINAQRGPKG